MTGMWLVLLKAEVLLFAIGAVVVLIAGIVNIALEYRERKQNAAEPEEKKDILETAITEETERGIITKCSASNRCAAVTGILELEREREQLREEYDELRERYKILCLAYEGKEEALELTAVVFHCYVDIVLRDAKRFYVPDADKQRKKFNKIISHETHLL